MPSAATPTASVAITPLRLIPGPPCLPRTRAPGHRGSGTRASRDLRRRAGTGLRLCDRGCEVGREHDLDLGSAHAPVDPVDDALPLDEDECRYRSHSESLGQLRL